jgi:hypothetical protein
VLRNIFRSVATGVGLWTNEASSPSRYCRDRGVSGTELRVVAFGDWWRQRSLQRVFGVRREQRLQRLHGLARLERLAAWIERLG